MPEGREEAVCRRLLRLAPGSLLSDCFCATEERWFKRNGAWSTGRLSLYRGYAFTLSPDVAGLVKELAHLTVLAELTGMRERSWVPLDNEAARWLASVVDDGHVISSSTAVIVGGVLRMETIPWLARRSA